MSESFEYWHVPRLRDFLKDRGITVAGYNKPQLVKLAKFATELGLPEDVNMSTDIQASLAFKLQSLGLQFSDPFSLDGYTSDLSDIPPFGLYDIFNYLILRRSDYDRKKLKAFKSFEDYRLFVDGHVESVMFNALDNSSPFCVFKCKVKPTQKDKTYLNKQVYDLWVILNSNSGEVELAYCQCPGGYVY